MIVAGVVVLLILGVLFLSWTLATNLAEQGGGCFSFILAATCFTLVGFSSKWVEYTADEPAAVVVIFGEHNRVIRVSTKSTWCTASCANAAGRYVGYYEARTENSRRRGRKLEYQAVFVVTDWQRFFDTVGVKPTRGKIPDYSENSRPLADVVDQAVKHWNAYNAETLTGFSTRMDAREQTRLGEMLKAGLNPVLRTYGVRMSRLYYASFD